MFDINELASLDSNYFTVIYKDIYDVTPHEHQSFEAIGKLRLFLQSDT